MTVLHEAGVVRLVELSSAVKNLEPASKSSWLKVKLPTHTMVAATAKVPLGWQVMGLVKLAGLGVTSYKMTFPSFTCIAMPRGISQRHCMVKYRSTTRRTESLCLLAFMNKQQMLDGHRVA